MTEPLYRDDAYLRRCDATVRAVVDNGVVTDRTVFYPLGGGQPGDTGTLSFDGGSAAVADTRYGDNGAIVHVLADGAARPAVGDTVELVIDWERRYRHMRMHTALHVLGSVLKYGVTGGNIGAKRSRLDFDMEEPVNKEAVTSAMQTIVDADHAVGCRWITDAELDAQPELVRTMSVAPPRGAGRVRLLEIDGIDLQPCGGTHLKSTGEIGRVAVAKTEKKGKRNRRVYIELDS
ncbi:MAG: alanyl-tRNA editing protein [Pseudomonadota bacterium]